MKRVELERWLRSLERSRDGRAAEARGSDDVAQADVSAGEGGA